VAQLTESPKKDMRTNQMGLKAASCGILYNEMMMYKHPMNAPRHPNAMYT
jgi:hypothetical protein